MFFLAFNRRRFVRVAVEHNLAVELESPDFRDAYVAGTYPLKAREVVLEELLSRSTDQLCRSILSSFVAVLVVSLLALLAASLSGVVAPSLPLAVGKVASSFGGFLAGWATLFALGTPLRTIKEKTLPELVHPKVFSLLFVLGLFFAFLGQIW